MPAFVEDAVGKVTFASASVDEGAVVAFLLVVGALAGMVLSLIHILDTKTY